MMNPDNEALLVQELRRDEGVRYVPYADTRGIPTVGVGHNLQASPPPAGWSYPLTDDQVNELLACDLANVYADLDRDLPWWRTLSDVRQRVVCNMCFNLGMGRLAGFRNTLAAMRQGNYSAAAEGMLSSAWAGQVKQRATRLAQMMRTGAAT
jgi:lysozyme